MPNDAIQALVTEGPVLARGIGGSRTQVDIDGSIVFVKRVPLTDLEISAANFKSTANVFGLPPYCQYGVGSPGFTAWRELLANERLTALSLDAGSPFEAVPAMYHWRVIDGSAFDEQMPEELSHPKWLAERWHGSAAVEKRVAAIKNSTSTLALFLEFIPHRLDRWLQSELEADGGQLAAAITLVERQLVEQILAMNRNGVFHFDAHFANILTDGDRLYFADYGLATSPFFDLDAGERQFLEANSTYDLCNVVTRLVNQVVATLCRVSSRSERNGLIRGVAAGASTPHWLDPVAAVVIKRYATVAAVINEFNERLYGHDRRTPYPSTEAAAALAAIGFA